MSSPSGFTWMSWADTQEDALRDDDLDYEEDEEIILRQEQDYDDWSRT